MEKEKVGKVFTYFSKVGVAGIELTDGPLAIGDKISIEGATTNLEQDLDSMQIDRTEVASAKKGQQVGLKVKDRVRPGDVVYKIIE
ncbi:translation elongation factor-like protein [archaeon]|nr:translation elongation factor-like protein [archaeon]